MTVKITIIGGQKYDIRQIYNQSARSHSAGREHSTDEWPAGDRTCTYPERSDGEGQGRGQLHLPKTRRQCPADRTPGRTGDKTPAEGAGRTAVSL